MAGSKEFKTKIEQAREMILKIASWRKVSLLVVVDSWFGNGRLYLPLKEELGSRIHILSMLRKNSNLFDSPESGPIKKRGRPKKYGNKAGNVRALAKQYESLATVIHTCVYGKQRNIRIYTGIWMSWALKCEIKVVFAYYKNVAEVLLNNAKPIADGRSGIKSVELLCAIYQSVKSGKKVTLPLE